MGKQKKYYIPLISCLLLGSLSVFAVTNVPKKKKFKRGAYQNVMGINTGFASMNQTWSSSTFASNHINESRKVFIPGIFSSVRFSMRDHLQLNLNFASKGSKNMLFPVQATPEDYDTLSVSKFNYLSLSFMLKHDLWGKFSNVCIARKCFSKFVGIYVFAGPRIDLLVSKPKTFDETNSKINVITYGLRTGLGIRGWFWALEAAYNPDFSNAAVIFDNFNIRNNFWELTLSWYFEI